MMTYVRHLWLTLVILVVIILYNMFESKTMPETTNKIQEEILPRHTDNNNSEEKIVQRRLQNAEEIWSRGVQKREAAAKRGLVSPFMFIWDLFAPDFNCPHNLERLGKVGDGGKWICGISQLQRKGKECVVYSYGIAGETTFEQAILDRTDCYVHGYDHTINTEKVRFVKQYSGRVTVSKLGIGVEDTENLRTLKSEMDARGHSFIDVLKMDVEGSEFKAMEQIIEDFPNGLPFGQLLIEIHLETNDTTVLKTLKGWWEKLEGAGLRAFHNEPNLYSVTETAKITLTCFEYSFINVKVDHVVLHA